MTDATLSLLAALAEPATRQAAIAGLAAKLAADAVLVLVEDLEVDALLPAPGFPQTLPGGSAWRAFLAAARRPGVHEGTVGYPSAERVVRAVAGTGSGITMVFVGDHCQVAAVRSAAAVIPILSSVLRAEQAALVAAGEVRVAQHTARTAEALARALDTARAEVETALQELERQAHSLQEARTLAEQATRAKDEFLAMLGHELRNPLSPIVMALQVMRLKGQASREQDIIERQVANVKGLVDDLLDVSRITTGKIELRMERVELAEVAARAVELASPVLERKRQMLEVRIHPRGLPLDADPARLAQILSNLLTNAAKYSDVERRIELSAERDGPRVRIRVRDQGIGLEPDMLDQIFNRFVQHRQASDRSEGGLGLGLAIVRSLVELHGGTVEAHSAGRGKGSEFVVDLPLALSSVGDRVAPVAADGPLGDPGAGCQRVMIVDDNQDAAVVLAEALELLGYSVRTAVEGLQALGVAKAFQPQVVLLDIGLPVIDGYEVALRLREMYGATPLRLIAVTGYGQASDKQRSREGGFDDHLVKPVVLEQLVKTLRNPGVPAPEGNTEPSVR